MLLAIDPGLTTGLSVFDGSDNLVHSRSVKATSLGDLGPWLEEISPSRVVIERLPPRLRPELARVVYFFDSLFPDAVKIGPGEWKPFSRSDLLKFPGETFPQATVHEKDSFKLGKFYLHFYRQEEKSEV